MKLSKIKVNSKHTLNPEVNNNIKLSISRKFKKKAPIPFPQYFEKLKYYPQVCYNDVDHSFLWQK